MSPVGLARFCTLRSWLSQYEIGGANHYYAGPGQRETPREAVGVCTDWLICHYFASAE